MLRFQLDIDFSRFSLFWFSLFPVFSSFPASVVASVQIPVCQRLLPIFNMAAVTLALNGCDEIENLLKFCDISSESIRVKDTEVLSLSKVTNCLSDGLLGIGSLTGADP